MWTATRAPHAIAVKVKENEAVYVNGSFADIEDTRFWRHLLHNWAGVEVRPYVGGEHVMSERLKAGDTQFVLAANYDIARAAPIEISVPGGALPLSEAVAISKDGISIRL